METVVVAAVARIAVAQFANFEPIECYTGYSAVVDTGAFDGCRCEVVAAANPGR